VCLSEGPVRISGGLWIRSGATFVLGSEQSSNTGTIDDGVHATDPASVQIHFATINGGLDVQGGSGAVGGWPGRRAGARWRRTSRPSSA